MATNEAPGLPSSNASKYIYLHLAPDKSGDSQGPFFRFLSLGPTKKGIRLPAGTGEVDLVFRVSDQGKNHNRRDAPRQAPYFLSEPTKSWQKMAATAWGIDGVRSDGVMITAGVQRNTGRFVFSNINLADAVTWSDSGYDPLGFNLTSQKQNAALPMYPNLMCHRYSRTVWKASNSLK